MNLKSDNIDDFELVEDIKKDFEFVSTLDTTKRF